MNILAPSIIAPSHRKSRIKPIKGCKIAPEATVMAFTIPIDAPWNLFGVTSLISAKALTITEPDTPTNVNKSTVKRIVGLGSRAINPNAIVNKLEPLVKITFRRPKNQRASRI